MKILFIPVITQILMKILETMIPLLSGQITVI